MKARHLLLVSGLAFAFVAPQPAMAQADLLTAKKFSCIPDRLTRCSAENKCETKDATPRDKRQLLVIDTEKKTAVFRRENNEERQFGTIVDDKVEGDLRKLTMRDSADATKPPKITITLTRAGKFTMVADEGRRRAEATCSPET